MTSQDTGERLLAHKRRRLRQALAHDARGRTDLAAICRVEATNAGMEASNHPIVDTRKSDGLGRPIHVDQVGRRHWRPEDSERPAGWEHLSDDQWHLTRRCHGPVACGRAERHGATREEPPASTGGRRDRDGRPGAAQRANRTLRGCAVGRIIPGRRRRSAAPPRHPRHAGWTREQARAAQPLSSAHGSARRPRRDGPCGTEGTAPAPARRLGTGVPADHGKRENRTE